MMRRTTLVLVCGAFLLLGSGCARKQQNTPGMELLGEKRGSVAGVTWSVPGRWTEQGQRQMRVATYTIPAAEGDAEGAECAVFYFGSDQGGGVAENIDRWVQQFESPRVNDDGTKTPDAGKVTLVKISGTYTAPSGPMMMSTGKKENYELLGAILEGPQGMVFFKFTGPQKTVDAAHAEFTAMIESLSKQQH